MALYGGVAVLLFAAASRVTFMGLRFGAVEVGARPGVEQDAAEADR